MRTESLLHPTQRPRRKGLYLCGRCLVPLVAFMLTLVADIGMGMAGGRLVSPPTGPHAGVRCEQCHTGAGTPPEPAANAQCLTCHPAVAQQIQSGQRRHGVSPYKDERSCATCHTSHPESSPRFNHAATGWPLTGAHARVDCIRCHRDRQESAAKGLGAPPTPSDVGANKDAPAAQTPRTCVSCHTPIREHRVAVGERCERCHTPADTKWRNHNAGVLRLEGAHDRLDCKSCHNGRPDLRGMATTCVACHQQHDVHHNALGPRCGDCHTQQTFGMARFNHDTVGCTLRGAHRSLPCIDCHKGGNYAGLSPLCISCHRDDAIRAARQAFPEVHLNNTACSPCHNTRFFRGSALSRGFSESVCQ